MSKKFTTFEEFWPFYLGEHAHPLNRRLHLVGTSTGILVALLALLRMQPMMLLAAPLCGYGMAWVGHFIIEKNRPATFTHPLWSLRGDFRMLKLGLMGKLSAEVKRLGIEKPA